MRFLVSLLLLAMPPVIGAQTPPEGYRFPTEGDYAGGWQEFRANLPVPFHVTADFNGDSLIDEAWILLPEKGKTWTLTVFLRSSRTSFAKPIILERESDTWPVSMGIDLVPPGSYETACGKGYWECKGVAEPPVLILKTPAINFFLYESANSFFWWDSKAGRFRRTWISD